MQKCSVRYFCKVRRKSNVCIIRFDWLIYRSLFFYLISSQREFSNRKTVVSGNKSVMSKNHCARTSCWWVRACAPQILSVRLPNWYFSLHLPPLQRPGICAVDNFQRFRFGCLPIGSQERLKQESTFTFTFTLRTIYNISKGVDLPPKMKETSPFISHTHSL